MQCVTSHTGLFTAFILLVASARDPANNDMVHVSLMSVRLGLVTDALPTPIPNILGLIRQHPC